MTAGRYPEKAIQEATSAWLASNWGFSEAFDDVEALGARFDSVGVLGGQLTLIEYKVGVSANIVQHAPDKSMSLESKISGGLRAVYGRSADPLSVAANKVWDRTRPPLVVIAASSFSDDALALLRAVVENRSGTWQFDFAAWRWTGDRVDPLLKIPLGISPSSGSYDVLAVPLLSGVTPRSKSRSLEELLVLGEQAGQRTLLDAFVATAGQAGCSLETGRSRLGAKRKIGGKLRLIAVAYVQAGEAGRLNVGIDATLFSGSEFLANLPKAPAVGYLNTNLYAYSAADLTGIFEKLGD